MSPSWHAQAVKLAGGNPTPSLQDIANIVGVTRQRVGQVLHAEGVDKPRANSRSPVAEWVIDTCPVCLEQFQLPNTSQSKLCSLPCRRVMLRARAFMRPVPDVYTTVKNLYGASWSIAGIAQKLGCTKDYASRLARELGLLGGRWPVARQPAHIAHEKARRAVRKRAWMAWWDGATIGRIAKMCSLSQATMRIELARAQLLGEFATPLKGERALTLIQVPR